MNNPIVSISCITFNHAPFIRECLDGFLMQKSDFKYEILIHDDASTDGTADIIREYEAKHPEIIKPIYQKENQFSKGIKVSATFNWSRAKGKYIALCEGDDYWTDPLKLQKQVDLLEKNEDYYAVSHNSKFIGLIDGIYSKEKSRVFQTKDLVKARPFHTNTILFRNEKKIIELYNSPQKIISGDKFINIIVSLFGDIYYSDEIMSVYRKSVSSFSNTVLYKDLLLDFNMLPALNGCLSIKNKMKLRSYLHLCAYTNGKHKIPFFRLLFHYSGFMFYSFSYFPHNIGDIKWGTIFLFRRLKK